ncbi:MAG: SIMPL domain-containing protein [Polyangiaceae bacterium]
MKTKPQAAKQAKRKQIRGTLAVTGTGEIKVRPDIAVLDLSVSTHDRSAQRAVQQNAECAARVIEAMRDIGIRAADMQTVGYDVIPILDRDEKSPTYGHILEYRVISQLRVRTSVEDAGETIDAAVRAGANMVSGVRYTVRDEAGVRARALKAAVKAAHRDAEAVAESMMIKLREAEQIEINVGGSGMFFREMAMAKTSLSTPIEPGNIEIRASVRVVYRTC